MLESWTTLAALAARTNRIRLGTAVTNAAVRNPAMLRKQAITLDQFVDALSAGRLRRHLELPLKEGAIRRGQQAPLA